MTSGPGALLSSPRQGSTRNPRGVKPFPTRLPPRQPFRPRRPGRRVEKSLSCPARSPPSPAFYAFALTPSPNIAAWKPLLPGSVLCRSDIPVAIPTRRFAALCRSVLRSRSCSCSIPFDFAQGKLCRDSAPGHRGLETAPTSEPRATSSRAQSFRPERSGVEKSLSAPLVISTKAVPGRVEKSL